MLSMLRIFLKNFSASVHATFELLKVKRVCANFYIILIDFIFDLDVFYERFIF